MTIYVPSGIIWLEYLCVHGGLIRMVNSDIFFKIEGSFNCDKYEDFTNEELVKFIKKHNEVAEEELYIRYAFIVKKIVSSFFILGGDKDDLFQEAMIGLMNAIKIYDKDINNNFRAFAEICIRRQIVSFIRRSNTHKRIILNESVSIYESTNNEYEECILDKLVDDERNNPENVMLRKEEKKFYEEVTYEVLSNFEMEVLHHYLNGKTYEEIAISLKKQSKSIDNALQRIKKKMKNYKNKLKK